MDEKNEASHDLSLEFSFDEDFEPLASTPTKLAKNISEVNSEASTPKSFLSPSYSPVSVVDSSNLQSLDECITEETDGLSAVNPRQHRQRKKITHAHQLNSME